MADAPEADLASLPVAYRAWRASELGRITDQIEEALIIGLIGPIRSERVLDVGCGDGMLSVRLAREGADVTGLDSDPRMLAAARDRASRSRAVVAYVEGNATSLPFADDSFDVVVAVTVLCFVPDAGRALSEMARVLRPGGRLVIGELGRYSLWAVKRRLSGWLGSRTWRAAFFRSARELKRLATAARLDVAALRGAIYYPPCDLCARWLAPLDSLLAAVTTTGAAFIALAATKRSDHSRVSA
jgi:ubiquinone biosynthesis O-methyltransferase